MRKLVILVQNKVFGLQHIDEKIGRCGCRSKIVLTWFFASGRDEGGYDD